jgi:hypothetical protein
MTFSRYIMLVMGVAVVFSACSSAKQLEGKWEYSGGIYNGKSTRATPDFKMQRTYTDNSYEAFLIENGGEPVKYGAGTYEIKADTFKVTSTYSNQPSQTLGKTVNYLFKVKGKKLTISGVLPNGMTVEEYWEKID